jgi:O-antigen ligase
MTNRVVLTLVFTLSFMSYMAPDLSTSVQLAPLGLFAALVFFKVLWSNSILDAVWSLFELDGLVFVIFVSVLMLAPSVASGSERSFETALLISSCLILARLYMAVVPIPEVLDAFFWSGILSVTVFVLLSFGELMRSVTTLARFWAFSFHPNLLAWLLAGYFCVAVWKFIAGNWRIRILAGIFGLVCIFIIVLASSRGALLGILAGCVFAGGMALARAGKEQRKSFLRVGLVVAALVTGFVFFVQDFESTKDTYRIIDQVLSLSTSDRGIDSGLTGRTDTWRKTIRSLSDGSWLYGRGIRSSDSLDPMIDNSYLVILYELGLLSLILIVWRYLSILREFFANYFCAGGQEEKCFYLAASLLMVVVLVTNFVERSLFAVGNPFSLLVFFLFATPASFKKQLFRNARLDPLLSTTSN